MRWGVEGWTFSNRQNQTGGTKKRVGSALKLSAAQHTKKNTREEIGEPNAGKNFVGSLETKRPMRASEKGLDDA